MEPGIRKFVLNIGFVFVCIALFFLLIFVFRLHTAASAALCTALYGIVFLVIFLSGRETQRDEEPDEGPPPPGWGQRHLPLLIFLATLSGSLLGALGSLSEALNLFVPVWEMLYPAPQIRAVGSNTILGDRLQMAAQWKKEFQELNKWQEKIPIVGDIYRVHNVEFSAIGSLKGIREAKERVENVHVLLTSEPVSDEDSAGIREKGGRFHRAAEIGYDLIVFVTDKNNPLPVLTAEDIRRILRGELKDWSQLGFSRSTVSKPIVIFARKGSGTTDVVLQAFTDFETFPEHFTECDSNSDCLNRTVGTSGSLYWVSLSWLYTQPADYMQVILLQAGDTPPTNPYDESFNPAWYPPELFRPLYMYVLNSDRTSPESLKIADEFFKFVRGVRGQKILEQHHFYTYFNPPARMDIRLPERVENR